MGRPRRGNNKEAPKEVIALVGTENVEVRYDEEIQNLHSRIDLVLELLDKSTEAHSSGIVAVKDIDTTKEVSLPPSDIKSRVPATWREKINQILGTDFDAEVKESSGGNYTLIIYLPTSLDRRVGEKTGRDVSTGLIRRASDISDVEKWCNLILQNIQKTYPTFKK